MARLDDALNTFGAALAALFDELDWELLGRAACEGDGSTFYDDELRERVLDTGLRFADDLGGALRGAGRASLYLGAEIAELPLILAERLVLDRRVAWVNVDSPATAEVARALRAVGARVGVELPEPRFAGLAGVEPGSCDHLWMVSVLTDPDAFPALHDELYERAGGPLATGCGDLADERARAEALAAELLDRAAPRCVLSTSDEERAILEPLIAARGWSVAFAPGGRLTAIVGDRVRIGTLERG